MNRDSTWLCSSPRAALIDGRDHETQLASDGKIDRLAIASFER